jgi:hypothetical protein
MAPTFHAANQINCASNGLAAFVLILYVIVSMEPAKYKTQPQIDVGSKATSGEPQHVTM